MCGICGKAYFDRSHSVDPYLLRRMIAALHHRGPDGNGAFFHGPVGLGHARLSIIDIRTGGQPISNEDASVWLVYNGEIYNFTELRNELIGKGHHFRSTSDTEVIVHMYEEEGYACVSRFRGMFAFALWDTKKNVLFCARDRVGIKPFYYAQTAAGITFASEIKALLVDDDVGREVNPQAIDRFLSFSYVPGDMTLLKGILKLPPGHTLVVENGQISTHRYWELSFAGPPPCKSFNEAAEMLQSRVRAAVKDHMVSDVPVGVLLSGGVDSSIVLSCAAENSTKKIQTFTIGFDRADFADERPFAKLAAERFGAEHHAITVSPQDFSGFLDDYVWHMEEPVYEAPAIALHYVSKLARRHVKVVLSGEGADEAFGGYHNYRNLLLVEKAKTCLSNSALASLSQALKVLGRLPRGTKFAKLAPLLRTPLSEYYYSRRSSPFGYFRRERARLYSPELIECTDEQDAAKFVRELFGRAPETPALHQMLYIDSATWLPDDLLVKADKMTMANSLELRVPFLDHELLKFAGSLPADYKVRGFQTKAVLKAAFSEVIPEQILTRKKLGFPVPLGRWLRTDLKAFVHDTLLSQRCLSRGYFARAEVTRLVTQCFAGAAVAEQIFSLLALELWHRRFADRPEPAEAALVPSETEWKN
jgi:asparagine synthase (glutamine-hydrolysing)